jgi:ribonucleotide monophosphatase NagD (HAD superfamily)
MTVAATDIPVLDMIKGLGARYRAWLVDIWGVMHNGHRAFPRAVAATRAFRAGGGIGRFPNCPSRALPFRISSAVRRPWRYLWRDRHFGDLTRHELAKHEGATVFHLGPERDRPIFAGLDVKLGGPDQSELVVCSGLFDDETETPEDYAGLLSALAARKLPMICANPDHLVERGDRLGWCAGALAAAYEKAGGPVVYAGKPYAPIYALACETIATLAGRAVAKGEILAVGDGVHTDIAGAAGAGIASVFIASGLHAPANSGGEAGGDALDAAHLDALFAHRPARSRPCALVW